MPKINRDWVEEQFIQAKVKIPVGKAVLQMLDAWEKISIRKQDIDETHAVFAKISKGHSLVESDPEYVWADAQPGQISVADVMRVKSDAFEDELGTMHNGREGVVVAIRYGDVIFKSTDGKEPLLDGVHYSPYKLQKRLGKK